MKFLLAAITAYVVALFCTHITEGFEVARLMEVPYLKIPSQGNVLIAKQILNQPFHYLAKGGQVFVFASKDEKYVLKFFKNTPHPLVPLSKYRLKKTQKLLRDINSYKLGFDRLLEETGLIFLHVNPEEKIDAIVCLKDKLGIEHRVPLNQTLFVLQKKGEPLTSYIKHAPHPKLVAQTVLELIKKREKIGVFDADPALHRNIGFLDDTPFFLDPGRFVLEGSENKPLPPKFIRWLYSENAL